LLEQPAPLELKLSRSALDRLGSGKLKLFVEVDGVALARRTIHTSGS
jgi:hypothetical protein